jgi:hypothetical protein
MSLAGCNTQYWCFYEWVDGDGQYQYTSYWVNDPSWYLVTSRCYDSAQSIVGSTLLSLEDTLDSGGVITRFCVDAWGAMWGENGWNGLDFYVNLKVFRKVGNTLLFIGESGDRHIQTTPRHWVNYGYGWELGFSEGDYIEGPISFDCFIPGCRAGDIIGLYGYGPYDGEWGYVYCTTQSDPNYLRHSGSVTTDTPISQWGNHHSGRWSVSVEIGIPEGVSGFMLFPDDARRLQHGFYSYDGQQRTV